MDYKKLSKKLKKTKLILGDVSKTISKFNTDYNPAPIGAIFFDLDYYTSTINAFKIFENSDEKLLPRIICYFDDLQPHVIILMAKWLLLTSLMKNSKK